MTLLEKLRANVSDQLVKPLKDEMATTDWGYVDTNIKFDPASMVFAAIIVIVVAISIISIKKVI
jgi:hypothetical protein